MRVVLRFDRWTIIDLFAARACAASRMYSADKFMSAIGCIELDHIEAEMNRRGLI